MKKQPEIPPARDAALKRLAKRIAKDFHSRGMLTESRFNDFYTETAAMENILAHLRRADLARRRKEP